MKRQNKHSKGQVYTEVILEEPSTGTPTSNALLMESGSYLLLETGDKILKES